ncbi:MAG: hypothetical protein JRJ31_00535 [Deltaproteobacteria bacterium]|nr:hypothetical protein [Deltaproteobacteria bacterium]
MKDLNWLIKLTIIAAMLLGLPPLGILAAGRPIGPYLQFPPKTLHIQQAPFSWFVFFLLSAFLLSVICPFVVRGLRPRGKPERRERPLHPLPLWGWAGLALGILAWVTAWTRLPLFSALQPHTFTPIWYGYILFVSSLAFRKTGRCMLMNQPRPFLLLFPGSALFWWFFEFLNRFVHNWYYVGKEFGPWEYFWYATLPFSTVLPAVLSTRELILASSWLRGRFSPFLPLKLPRPPQAAIIIMLLAGLGLAMIGIYPDYLFPLLWVSPFLIILSLQVLFGDQNVFSLVPKGDWTFIVSSALAALICGFFWEMWNFYSFAKWKYTIPFVQRFHVFEMPLLGYAGYLPFGLECAAVAQLLFPSLGSSRDTSQGIVE